jgi:hypothetical protein
MPTAFRTILLLVVPPVAVLVSHAFATQGTSREGGRVPIPGERVVQLEAGTAVLHYEERRNLEEGNGTLIVDEADFLEIPQDLQVTVTPRGGGRALALDRTSFGSVVEDEQGSRKVFAKVEVPRRAAYTVVTAPVERDARSPAVTFGEDALSEFLPWGLGALAASGCGALLAAALALVNRVRDARGALA